MSRFIYGTVFGVLITVGFFYSQSKEQIAPVLQEVVNESADVKEAVLEREPSAVSPQHEDYETLGVKKMDKVITIAPPQDDLTAEKPAQVRNIDINVSHVMMMEDNLEEIRRDVAFVRDEKGWIVRFYAQPNSLSELGFRNDDLIRLEQMEKIKSRLPSADLAYRLQTVIEKLER